MGHPRGTPRVARADARAQHAFAGRVHGAVAPSSNPPMTKPSLTLRVLGADDKLAEIRRLYFATTKQTIAADLSRAVQLLKSMATEEERERARVYMDGLAQMRSDWARQPKRGDVKQRSKK